MTRRLLALCVLLIALPAYALVIDTPLPNTEDEARARSLFYELRCQVCQGQSVADSDAVVARRLRDFVRERVSQGDSSDAIRDAIVEQYGESVLFKSRVNARFGTVSCEWR